MKCELKWEMGKDFLEETGKRLGMGWKGSEEDFCEINWVPLKSSLVELGAGLTGFLKNCFFEGLTLDRYQTSFAGFLDNKVPVVTASLTLHGNTIALQSFFVILGLST